MAPAQPTTVVDAMRQLADADCARPPELYTVDGNWCSLVEGTVVATDAAMVAVQPQNPASWPAETTSLLLWIHEQGGATDIKANAVVVGHFENLLIARLFPPVGGKIIQPTPGDRAVVDFATSHTMRNERLTARR